MSAIDVGGTVRAGEELDAVAVENWLKAQGVLDVSVEIRQS